MLPNPAASPLSATANSSEHLQTSREPTRSTQVNDSTLTNVWVQDGKELQASAALMEASALTIETQRAAQQLTQLIRSSGGISRLNAMKPEERQNLAAKVQAFQHQLRASSSKKINSVFHLIVNQHLSTLMKLTRSAQRTNRIDASKQQLNWPSTEIHNLPSLIQPTTPPAPFPLDHTDTDNLSAQRPLRPHSERNVQAIQRLLTQNRPVLNALQAVLQQSNTGVPPTSHKIQEILASVDPPTATQEAPSLQEKNGVHRTEHYQYLPAAQSQVLPSLSASVPHQQRLVPPQIRPDLLGTSGRALVDKDISRPVHYYGTPLTPTRFEDQQEDVVLQRFPANVAAILRTRGIGERFPFVKKELPIKSRNKVISENSCNRYREFENEQKERAIRALKRRKVAMDNSNSAESQIWKLRNDRSALKIVKTEGHEQQIRYADGWSDAHSDTKKDSNLILWDGSRFLQFNSVGAENSQPTSGLPVPFQYAWDGLFSDGVTTTRLSDIDRLTNGILADVKGDEVKMPFVMADQSIENPLNVCVLLDEQRLVTPLFPPSFSRSTVLQSPFHLESSKAACSVPQTAREELQYTQLTDARDPLLREVLRSKWHLSSDLMINIPPFAYGLAIAQNNASEPCAEVIAQARSVRTNRRAPVDDDDKYTSYYSTKFQQRQIDFYNSGQPDATGVRRRRRTPKASQSVNYGSHDVRELNSPVSMSSIDVTPTHDSPVPMNDPSVDGIDRNLASSFMSAESKGPHKSLTNTFALGRSLEAEIDAVKKKTGWHPYVWYLMCRRPELYNIDIRARLVARVAGWEWEDIQKLPDTLRLFLDRIWEFVDMYPVPRYTDKREAKEYKNFVASSVRTPWNGQETAAVKRALRDILLDSITSTGMESDSIVSDGGLSTISTGHQTPTTIPACSIPTIATQTSPMETSIIPDHPYMQQEDEGSILQERQLPATNFESLPSLVAKIINENMNQPQHFDTVLAAQDSTTKVSNFLSCSHPSVPSSPSDGIVSPLNSAPVL